MLFVSNRRILGSRRSEVGREIRFDLDDNEPSTSLFFCERKAPGHYVELLSAPFLLPPAPLAPAADPVLPAEYRPSKAPGVFVDFQ